MIFSGSSKTTYTAPDENFQFMFSLTLLITYTSVSYPCNYTPAYEVWMVYSFRRFNHHICKMYMVVC